MSRQSNTKPKKKMLLPTGMTNRVNVLSSLIVNKKEHKNAGNPST